MCWGRNDRGQMANATAPSPSPVPVPVEGISGRVTDVAVGVLHTCALRESGEVMCWGTNEYGQLGNGSDTTVNTSVPVEVSDLPRTVLDIDTEFEHICALLEGGEMMCWGQNSDGQLGDGTMDNIRTTPVSVQGLPSAVTAMTLGALHTCVLLENATVWCWGHNSVGEIGIGSDEPEQRPEPGEVHCR
jgi:alpha-tubulin suppressor-like RCC1 family protein